MTSIWLTIIIVGILTYLTRLSFIVILPYWRTPPSIQRALRFIPVSVFAAIVLPELTSFNNSLHTNAINLRFFAGILAAFIAWKTKNVAWTILIGMGALLFMQSFF
ncbi:MAG: AzlD domain-containing protein [Chloroflexi bacterium]|nr:AzlD domain-containing protein [Chloroflexota bacterium]